MPLPPDTSTNHARQGLRRELRARRRALGPSQQRRAARALAHRLIRQPALKRARHIALYWPMDGEIDPLVLLKTAGLPERRFYLPVLQPFPANTLRFARWQKNARKMQRNRFGIPEPRSGQQRHVQEMDVVLLPLTGFDRHGNRLGMGGGFYDRTLARLRHHQQRPWLIGVAHHCQQVGLLPTERWDIPLHLVVTDRETIRPR